MLTLSTLEKGSVAGSERTTEWRPIYVAGAASFVISVQFSICMSSMLHYLQWIDPTSTEEFYGYVVASYSLGQMISSPLFGYLGSRTRHSKSVVNVGMGITILGNLLYVWPLFGRYSLLLSRFLVGFGGGNLCLLRSYAASASTPTDRATAIAIVTGGQTLGQTGGAVFHLLFSSFSTRRYAVFGILPLTGVAYFAIVLNVIGAALLHFCFQAHRNRVVDKDEIWKTVPGSQTPSVNDLDRTAVMVCHMTRFVQLVSYASLQT
ncbi:Protein F27D9.2 [Aphelenchoides avenae]|nr:Protein F27D9.2 [Aphelenchus avenae]